MNDLALHDRPREKLLRVGGAGLGDNELVALVLGTGVAGEGALSVANRALQHSGGVGGLARATAADLVRVRGIGWARAVRLVAALELGRRSLSHGGGVRRCCRTPSEAAAFLLPRFGARAVEQFGLVLLDAKHRVLRTAVVSTGTLNATVVHPRDVFREALLGSAAAVLAFHNHPSGDPSPSAEDVALTRRLVAAGTLMGIEVIDHIILGDTRYCSLKELGQV